MAVGRCDVRSLSGRLEAQAVPDGIVHSRGQPFGITEKLKATASARGRTGWGISGRAEGPRQPDVKGGARQSGESLARLVGRGSQESTARLRTNRRPGFLQPVRCPGPSMSAAMDSWLRRPDDDQAAHRRVGDPSTCALPGRRGRTAASRDLPCRAREFRGGPLSDFMSLTEESEPPGAEVGGRRRL